MSGGSRVPIPKNVQKTIQNIREIAGNHSDEVVYAMLKESSMDPNETAQKLLLQDTFHEVKMKRDRKKERRGGRDVRGSYIKEHKDAEKCKQIGVSSGKLNIAMGTVSQTSIDMCPDVQHKEENSPLDMLEDVDLGRDTPSPFFSGNESAPDQSRSDKPSISSRRKKRPEISTDDTFMFLDTMKEIAAVLRDAIKSEDDKVEEKKWIEALTEIPDMPIQWMFRAPEWFDTKIKRNMFTKMTVEERLQWLKYCSGEM